MCEVAPAIDGRGRRLLTTAPFPVGALLHSEPPWAAVPTDLASTCAATFVVADPAETSRRLAACGRCRVVRYVDRAAQAADWHAHKPECAALIAASPHIPSPTVRLAARCLWRAATAPSSSAPLDALESHWDGLPLRRQAAIAQVAALTRRFMSCGKEEEDGGGGASPPPLLLPSLPIIARLVARLAVNAHTITGGGAGLDRVGLGLYVGGGAMANHGHPPTAVQAFGGGGGGVLQLRALRALGAGEEVTLAYTDAARPRPARRAALLDGYCFDIDAAAGPPPDAPPPQHQWAAPDGSVTATATSTRPPCVDGDPEACTEVGGASSGGGAVAWLEAVEADDAAASFLLGDGDDEDGGDDKAKRPPPAPPPVCRVVAWGAWVADAGALARVAAALAAAERAADAVEASLDGPGGNSAAALAAADQGAAALTALARAGGPVPGPAHFTAGRLAAATLRAALAAGDFSRALVAARAATPLLDAALPAASPVRAHLHAERAKLAAWAGGNEAAAAAAALLDREALAAAEAAVAALRVCSPAAPARAETEALVGNLRAEAEGRARMAAAESSDV